MQGKPVALVADILAGDSTATDPITSRLAELKENIVGPNTLAVAGVARKSLSWPTNQFRSRFIKTIMSTCTDGGYENVSLAVIQKAAQVAGI